MNSIWPFVGRSVSTRGSQLDVRHRRATIIDLLALASARSLAVAALLAVWLVACFRGEKRLKPTPLLESIKPELERASSPRPKFGPDEERS
jgi:hypothetical protein